jgi:hypothetical protein
MALASVGLVLAGPSELVHRFEHKSFPLSWIFAILAILAFFAAELTLPEIPATAKKQPENLQSPSIPQLVGK